MQARICVRQALPVDTYLFRLQPFALPSPDQIWPPFLLQLLGKRPGIVLLYFCGAGVDAWSRENPWHSRLRIFPVWEPCASLRPGMPGICQWPSFCQDTLRIGYVNVLMPWCHWDTLVLSVQQRFADTIPKQSQLKKTQEPRLVTYTALNCFVTSCYYVKSPLACLDGIVHSWVTQTQPMDVSMESIAAEDSQKTSVHLY